MAKVAAAELPANQGEKDQKLYAVIDAFAQNNGHLGVSEARYVNALKLFSMRLTYRTR